MEGTFGLCEYSKGVFWYSNFHKFRQSVSVYEGIYLNDNKRKLNIVMFGQKHIPSREGGVEIVVEELATRMADKGHNVICYNRKSKHVSGAHLERRDTYKGVHIKEVPTVDKKGLAAMTSSFFAAIASAFSNADVVHIHAEGPAIFSFLPKMTGKKVIVTIHGLDWARAKWGRFASWYIKSGEKNAVKYANEIIVLSNGVRDYFQKEYSRETRFIPNGVNRPVIREADIIKRKWGLEKNSYVLFLGRLVPEKGVHYLIEAFKGITDKKLVICGGSSDTQEYMNQLKAMDQNVIFTGFQQGQPLEELYSNAYVYCLPSDLEGMPLSLLEAMSYGNCCLTSDIAECAEVVEDKAVLFHKSDATDLRVKLEWLVSHEEEVMKYKSKAADFICGKYNWDDVVERTLGLYIE